MTFLQYLRRLNEALTIPPNEGDELEKMLYRKLPKSWTHADRVVRWYRNEKKSGTDEKDLKRVFVDNFANIEDLFKTYDDYISRLKKLKLLDKKIEVRTATKPVWLDPVKDVDRIRRLQGFRMLVSALGDMAHSDTVVDTPLEKYALNGNDRKNIRIVGLSSNLVCWATKGYETTNKFVYQIWRNDKTLGRGDVYGDPDEQTPYCTHSRQHWDDYAEGNPDYQQFWFFERLDNKSAFGKCLDDIEKGFGKVPDFEKVVSELHYKIGDLNDPEVVRIFNCMPYTQATLVCQNDTGGDLLDREDDSAGFENLPFGNQVKQIMDKYFKVYEIGAPVSIGGREFTITNMDPDESEGDSSKFICPVGERVDIPSIKLDEIEYPALDIRAQNITNLSGCPSIIKQLSLTDLPNLRRVDSIWRVDTLKVKNCPVLYDFSDIRWVTDLIIENSKIQYDFSKVKYPKDVVEVSFYRSDITGLDFPDRIKSDVTGAMFSSRIGSLSFHRCTSKSIIQNLPVSLHELYISTKNKASIKISGMAFSLDTLCSVYIDNGCSDWTFDEFPAGIKLHNLDYINKNVAKYLCWKILTARMDIISIAVREWFYDLDSSDISLIMEILKKWHDVHTGETGRYRYNFDKFNSMQDFVAKFLAVKKLRNNYYNDPVRISSGILSVLGKASCEYEQAIDEFKISQFKNVMLH